MSSHRRCRSPLHSAAALFLVAAALTLPLIVTKGLAARFDKTEFKVVLMGADKSVWCEVIGKVQKDIVVEVDLPGKPCRIVRSFFGQSVRDAREVQKITLMPKKSLTMVPWMNKSALVLSNKDSYSSQGIIIYMELTDPHGTEYYFMEPGLSIKGKRNLWTFGLYKGTTLDKVITVTSKTAGSGKGIIGGVKVTSRLLVHPGNENVEPFIGYANRRFISKAANIVDLRVEGVEGVDKNPSNYSMVAVVGPKDVNPVVFEM